MKKVCESISVTVEFLKKAKINIFWDNGMDHAVACTFYHKGEWNIALSRPAATEAEANEGNMLCFLHALWHEFGHIYLHSYGLVPPMGPYPNDPEEIWCDEFANMMMRQFGFNDGWRAPYLEDLL